MTIVLQTEEERKLWRDSILSVVRHEGLHSSVSSQADVIVLDYQKRLPLPEPTPKELSRGALANLIDDILYSDEYDTEALEEFLKDLRKQWFKEWRESA